MENTSQLIQLALSRAFQDEVAKCFSVLVDGLVSGDPTAEERFGAAIRLLTQALSMARSIAP